MLKKMMPCLAALALIALSGPMSANAQMLTEGGEPLAAESKVFATSYNTEMPILGLTTWGCEGILLVLFQIENEPTYSELWGFGGFKGCELKPQSFPVKMTALEVNGLFLEEEGQGHAFINLIFDAGVTCAYSGAVSISYETGSDEFALEGTLASGSCPKAGVIHGDFTLETEDGTPVTIG